MHLLTLVTFSALLFIVPAHAVAHEASPQQILQEPPPDPPTYDRPTATFQLLDPTRLTAVVLCAPAYPGYACTNQFITDWTVYSITKRTPYSFYYNDPHAAILKIVDAEFRTDRYAVSVDNKLIGITSEIEADNGLWCGNNAAFSRLSCQAANMSYGEFRIPSGYHLISIRNMQTPSDEYPTSNMIYSIQRDCPCDRLSRAMCKSEVLADWQPFRVRQGGTATPLELYYDFPAKVTVVDAGQRTEKYEISMDGTILSRTHDFEYNTKITCPTAGGASQAQQCLDKEFSSGVFVVLGGPRKIVITPSSPGTITGDAIVFYKVESYCTKDGMYPW